MCQKGGIQDFVRREHIYPMCSVIGKARIYKHEPKPNKYVWSLEYLKVGVDAFEARVAVLEYHFAATKMYGQLVHGKGWGALAIFEGKTARSHFILHISVHTYLQNKRRHQYITPREI